MTVIAAVVDRENGRVHMAADSWAINDGHLTVSMRKLHSAPWDDTSVVIGVAGRAMLIPIAARIINATPPDPTVPDHWAQKVAEQITTAGLEAGCTKPDGSLCAEILLAWRHHLWDVSQHSAIPVQLDYHAVGSGSSVALGVLWGLGRAHQSTDGGVWRPPEFTAEHMARWAVEAAAEHMAGIGGPITEAST